MPVTSAATNGNPTLVPPSTPTTTFTNTAISIATQSIASTSQSKISTVIATNPTNPTETAAFTKETLPESQRGNLPHIDDAAPLALLLLLGGTPTMVTVTSAFEIVVPLGAAPAWLTPALFPPAEAFNRNHPSASTPRVPSASSATTSSKKSSSSSSSSSVSATATETSFLVRTKPGTSIGDFQGFIKTLPDGGQGRKIAYPHARSQSYITNINSTFAKVVAKNPLVDVVIPNTPMSGDSYNAIPRQGATRRADSSTMRPPTFNLVRQVGSQTPLKLISQRAIFKANVLQDYRYDPIAGDDITIYVIDTGFFRGAQDFNFDTNGMVEGEDFYVVPRDLLQEVMRSSNVDSLTESILHGTCVASMAAGTTWGVAKNAKMIPVKFKNVDNARPAAIADAFGWVVNDVITKGIEGKAVINFSFGFRSDSSSGIDRKFMEGLFEEFWSNGIVTVIAAGNEAGSGVHLGDRLPQAIGKPDNPLITVGGIENDGTWWDSTSPKAGGNGSITVSLAAHVTCASSGDPAGFRTQVGTSFAAPQVAGLAAYFLSLPILQARLHTGGYGRVAQNVKDYIVQAANRRLPLNSPDGNAVFAAYNLADDAICLLPFVKRALPKRAGPTRASPNVETILVSGTLVATDVDIPCRPSTSSMPGGSSSIASSGSKQGTSTSRTASSSSSLLSSSVPTSSRSIQASSTSQATSPSSPQSPSKTSTRSRSTQRSATSQATPSPSSTPSGTSTRGSSTSAAPSGTLNCHQNVPTGGPSGRDIANSLKGNNGIANVCAAEFNGSGDSNQETFNHGQLNIVVSRSPKNHALRYCEDAMNAIINVCILGSHDYGGVWTLDGEEYNVTNMVFPNNPLIPGADRGSQSSTTPKPTQTKPSPTLQPARTVTTNGAVCVLLPGSNNPVCNPIDTPTPNPGGTNIHVNKGCISINGSPRCQDSPPYSKNPLVHEVSFLDLLTMAEDVANQNQPYSQATIYANFNAGDTVTGNVTPGCELSARWPSNYGDVYFGEGNCLYDSGGNRIYDECCKGSTTASVQNPYQKIALCYKDSDNILGIPTVSHYTIFINGWVSDGGAALKDKVKGCGDTKAWNFQTTTDKTGSSGTNRRKYQYVATFTLPYQGGCVGPAIKRAGGPDGIHC